VAEEAVVKVIQLVQWVQEDQTAAMLASLEPEEQVMVAPAEQTQVEVAAVVHIAVLVRVEQVAPELSSLNTNSNNIGPHNTKYLVIRRFSNGSNNN
jgi:hypothetical protein